MLTNKVRVAMVKDKSGKGQAGFFYQVRENLNPCTKSVKSQGILS